MDQDADQYDGEYVNVENDEDHETDDECGFGLVNTGSEAAPTLNGVSPSWKIPAQPMSSRPIADQPVQCTPSLTWLSSRRALTAQFTSPVLPEIPNLFAEVGLLDSVNRE